MADDSKKSDAQKEIDGISSSLRRMARDLEGVNRPLRDFEKNLDKAGNVVVDKVTEGMIDLYKASKILTDEQKDLAKSTKTVVELGKIHEKLGAEILRVREEYKKQKISARDVNKKLAELGISLGDAAKDASKLEAHLDDLAEEIKRVDKTVGDFSTTLNSNSARLSKTFDGLKSKMLESIETHASHIGVLKLTSTALSTLYTQYVRLANKGLNGSIMQMSVSAVKLRMTMDEFTDIVDKNRDIITALGNGSDGIDKFVQRLKDTSVGLEYLGKDAYKVAAQIQGALARTGFGPNNKDANVQKIHVKTTKQLNEQFRYFSGAFGDTAEMFSSYYTELLKSKDLQLKINAGDTANLDLMTDELVKRTESLRVMGLNNEQILNMTKMLESTFNPSKNRQAEAMKERANMRIGVISGAREMISRGIDPEAGGTLLTATQDGTLDKYMASGGNQAERLAAAGSDPKMRALAEAFGKFENARYVTKAAQGGDISRAFLSATAALSQSGPYENSLSTTGNMLLGAKAQGLDQEGNATARKNAFGATGAREVMGKNGEMVIETEAFTKALQTARLAVDAWGSWFSDKANPLVVGVTALGGALLLWSSTARGLLVRGLSAGAGLAAKSIGGAALSGGSRALGGAVGGGVAGVAVGGYQALSAYNDDSLSDSQKKTKYAQAAGSTVGGIIGGVAGAPLGPLGIVAGGAVGSILGGIAGDYLGSSSSSSVSASPTVQANTRSSSSGFIADPSKGAGPIMQVLQVGAGYNVVRRPDGSVVKITGDRNWRNNNPGNIEAGAFASSMGAIGSDGRFAIFPNYETGRAAKEKLIFQGKNYKDLSLSGAISRYAPSSENNTAAYQSTVLGAVGGVNKRMSDYTSDERQRIMDAMQRVEGFRTGKVMSLNPPTASSATDTTPISAAPAVSSVAAAAPAATDPISELKKQTDLLRTIASNSRPSLSKMGTTSNDQMTALILGA